MSLLLEKYQQLETALGEYLENLNAKPPIGFGTFLKPLNQSFQLCRIQGRLIQDQAKKLDELQNQLDSIKLAIQADLEATALGAVASADQAKKLAELEKQLSTLAPQATEAATDE